MALFFQRMAEGHSVDWLNVYMHFKEVCIILGGFGRLQKFKLVGIWVKWGKSPSNTASLLWIYVRIKSTVCSHLSHSGIHPISGNSQHFYE